MDIWRALPHGIQGVLEFEHGDAPNGDPLRVQVYGGDWYVWKDGRITTTPANFNEGTWENPPPGCGSCMKRSGRWLPDDEWETIRLEIWNRTWP